jgi:hypothetical protein
MILDPIITDREPKTLPKWDEIRTKVLTTTRRPGGGDA